MRGIEFIGDVAADATDAADDVVIAQFVDVFFHAASPQCFANMAFDQKGGDDRSHIRHDRDPTHGDDHGEHAPAGMFRQIDDLAIADGGDGDEGHVKTIEQRIFFAADEAIPGGADDEDRQQNHQRPEKAGVEALRGDGVVCGQWHGAVQSGKGLIFYRYRIEAAPQIPGRDRTPRLPELVECGEFAYPKWTAVVVMQAHGFLYAEVGQR